MKHTIEHSTLAKGLSVIEILVVLAIMGIITTIALPRFQDMNNESGYKKDILYFIDNVSRAQATVNAANSRDCAGTEKLDHIDIVRSGTSHYQAISYCGLGSTGDTPTPVPSKIIALESSQFDVDSESTFVSLYSDGTTIPGSGFTFVRGKQSCDISMSATGVITYSDTCPPQ